LNRFVEVNTGWRNIWRCGCWREANERQTSPPL